MSNDIDLLNELEELSTEDILRYLTGLVVHYGSVEKLLANDKQNQKDIYNQILKAKKSSANIISNNKPKENHTLLKIAVAGMLLNLARKIHISEKSSYLEKAQESIQQSEAKINQIITTEIYKTYNKSVLSNSKSNQFKWNAFHDKRTCSACASKDGKIYAREDIEEPPLHQNCRCILEPI